MWGKADLGVASCCITATLGKRASAFLRLRPVAAEQYACDTLKCAHVDV